MGFFDFLFGKKNPSLEEADKFNDDFIAKNPTPKNEEDDMMRLASKLMTSGQFLESLNVYLEMAEKFTHNKGLYLSQAGAACFFTGDLEKAVSYYVSAMENGADKSMMDDNIWEAVEKQYKETDNISHIQYYIGLFPNGNYIRKAQKYLQ